MCWLLGGASDPLDPPTVEQPSISPDAVKKIVLNVVLEKTVEDDAPARAEAERRVSALQNAFSQRAVASIASQCKQRATAWVDEMSKLLNCLMEPCEMMEGDGSMQNHMSEMRAMLSKVFRSVIELMDGLVVMADEAVPEDYNEAMNELRKSEETLRITNAKTGKTVRTWADKEQVSRGSGLGCISADSDISGGTPIAVDYGCSADAQ